MTQRSTSVTHNASGLSHKTPVLTSVLTHICNKLYTSVLTHNICDNSLDLYNSNTSWTVKPVVNTTNVIDSKSYLDSQIGCGLNVGISLEMAHHLLLRWNRYHITENVSLWQTSAPGRQDAQSVL